MNAILKLSCLPAVLLTTLAFLSFPSQRVESQETNVEALEFEVVQKIPHSEQYFTQGLFFHGENLYESTGQYGRSKLIRYDSDYQTVLMSRTVPAKYFAEGATTHKDIIYQLTWREETALAYEPKRLGRKEGFQYQGEGWGLVSDGEHLWLSNGSSQIKRLHENGDVLSSISVSMEGQPLDRLNELEWVNEQIFANRWHDTKIYVIDPESGSVTGSLDLEPLAQPELSRSRENVLNGIAWNPATETLWVTGKNWQSLYEIKLITRGR